MLTKLIWSTGVSRSGTGSPCSVLCGESCGGTSSPVVLATVLTPDSALMSDPANSMLVVRFCSINLSEAKSEERESGGGGGEGDREDHGGCPGNRDQVVGAGKEKDL